MSPLREGFRASQIVSIMNFVVVSSVGIMRVDCIYVLTIALVKRVFTKKNINMISHFSTKTKYIMGTH